MSSTLYDEPGPRGRRNVAIAAAVVGVAIAGLLAFVLVNLGQQGQLSAQRWAVLGRADLQRLLLQGLYSTAQVAIVAMVLSLASGVLLAVGRLSRRWWVHVPARIWVEVLRGLPTLLLIFFIFLGGPAVGLEISPFWSLTLGIALYNSGVMAEIFRAGILSLPKGQSEASSAIGLRHDQTLRLILIPQAVRYMLPALVSQLVIIIKETSLGFIVGYSELSRDGRSAVEFLGESYSLPVYILLASIYVTVCLLLSRLAVWLDGRTERRYGRLAVARANASEVSREIVRDVE